jgi:16S rRNA (cytosine967-C5)-methyltransferase
VAAQVLQQTAIVQSASRLLKSGGRLVYATCSLLPQENEEIALAFGAANPDFTPLDVGSLLAELKVPAGETLCSGPFLRLWPHRHATDGFFAAVWQRK